MKQLVSSNLKKTVISHCSTICYFTDNHKK